MECLKLEFPGPEHKQKAIDYIEEHFAHQEYDLHGAALMEKMNNYEAWLHQIHKNRDPVTVPQGWVVSSTFFAVRQRDQAIVGVVNIRHSLNEFLRNYGGHIGYGVRPLERNKGYATEILRQALDYCKIIGLNQVMLACYKENEASRRTILKGGGM
ncbi:MAG: GNAT family N-acetyltransferase [Bacteroides sp.]|nr:GNAT family N-acetyltransferase [Bacteroides sp.]